MRRVKLEDILGPEVRTSGQETKHVCLACGCKSLSLNYSKNSWFCFECWIGGRIEHGYTTPTMMPRVQRTWTGADGLPICPVKSEWRGILSSALTHQGCFEGLNGELHLMLRLDGLNVGYVFYNKEMGYKVHGQRGVAYSKYARPGQEYDRRTFLFEGFFDFLQVAAFGFNCIYLCGNQPSSEQIGELFEHFNDTTDRIFICFDNDLPAMADQLKFRLSLILDNEIKLLLPPLFGEVSGLLPPKNPIKDWDDNIRLNKAEALEVLRNA